MKKRLSAWWEQTANRGYIAKRKLVEPAWQTQVAPIEQIVVYYCGANFASSCVIDAKQLPTFAYLVNGEKEPPNAPEDSPWNRAVANQVGGVLRPDIPEIIPVFYVTFRVAGQETPKAVREYTSDQVPLVQNKSRTVRVIAGQFESAIHPVVTEAEITLLDVVLNQGGEFSWQVPRGYWALAYVLGGAVNFGRKDVLKNCFADTLVAVKGRSLYASAQCAGGRMLVVAAKQAGTKLPVHEAYEQVVLSDLDQVETKKLTEKESL